MASRSIVAVSAHNEHLSVKFIFGEMVTDRLGLVSLVFVYSIIFSTTRTQTRHTVNGGNGERRIKRGGNGREKEGEGIHENTDKNKWIRAVLFECNQNIREQHKRNAEWIRGGGGKRGGGGLSKGRINFYSDTTSSRQNNINERRTRAN